MGSVNVFGVPALVFTLSRGVHCKKILWKYDWNLFRDNNVAQLCKCSQKDLTDSLPCQECVLNVNGVIVNIYDLVGPIVLPECKLWNSVSCNVAYNPFVQEGVDYKLSYLHLSNTILDKQLLC